MFSVVHFIWLCFCMFFHFMDLSLFLKHKVCKLSHACNLASVLTILFLSGWVYMKCNNYYDLLNLQTEASYLFIGRLVEFFFLELLYRILSDSNSTTKLFVFCLIFFCQCTSELIATHSLFKCV